MKRLGVAVLLFGSAFAFSQTSFAQDRDDYRRHDREARHEWREHERHERREEREWRRHERREWRAHERYEQRQYRDSYVNPYSSNGFYDQYGVWRRY